MTQRTQMELFCVAVCLVIALICAFNRAPVLAVVHAVAGGIAWLVGFGSRVESVAVEAFIKRLRDVSDDAENRDAVVLGTVWPNVMFAPILPSQKCTLTLMSVVFRDELSTEQWRALSTRLRHQPRATPWPPANG